MNNHLTGLKNLAEAVIVQSMEDLWNRNHKKESADFFIGEGFRIASEMAGMSAVDRLKLLLILRGSVKNISHIYLGVPDLVFPLSRC